MRVPWLNHLGFNSPIYANPSRISLQYLVACGGDILLNILAVHLVR